MKYALPALAYADCYNNDHGLRLWCLAAPTRRFKGHRSNQL